MSASQPRAEDHERRDPKNRDKDRPFDPDGLPLVLQQFWEKVDNGNTQPIDGMEQHAEKNEDLEGPVLINAVQGITDVASHKGSKQMYRDKNRHPQPTNPMQDERQLVHLSPITQACPQWDIPLQAHLSLLDVSFLEIWHIISFRHFILKVTILMGYSFQTSSKKEGLDLYNPEWNKTTKLSYFTACIINQ
jgi:hypothetical protein